MCLHESFDAEVTVNRLPEEEGGPIKNYSADVRVKCHDCGLPFRFMGLPYGLDLRGAAVSVNGEEARLAIAPQGEVVNAVEGVGGFTVRKETQPGAEYKYGNTAGLEAKLLPGEPWFALRAKDKLSVMAVEQYARMCASYGLIEHADKVMKAANQMLAWQRVNDDKTKMPD